jgi:hypothetical protein
MEEVDRTDEKLIKIRGLVTPADWDERGKVRAIALSTFTEDEYVIEKNSEEKRLYAFMRKEIEVSGIIKETDGKKRIEVRGYRTR